MPLSWRKRGAAMTADRPALRDYQRTAVRHILTHPRCALWAGMGLGKTLTTLTALAILKAYGEIGPDRPALVLAPLRVASTTWPDECRKWRHLGLTCAAAVGDAKARAKAVFASGADIVTANYETLPWLVKTCGTDWPFACIVADEASRLKNFRLRGGGERARALASVAFRSPRFIELTGTPAPNGLLDLWGQSFFLDRGKRLGASFSRFTSRFFRQVRCGSSAFAVRYEPHDGAADEIQRALSDLALSIRAEDYFPTDAPIVQDIRVDLPPAARKLYAQLESAFFADLDALGIGEGEIDVANAAARSGKCLQVAAGAVYRDDGSWQDVHDAKIDALRSCVEEAAGEPVLVAYHWKADAARLKKAFPEAVELDRNPATIRRWNAGEIPVLLAHPAAAGHGLNLQDGGRRMVLFSPWWDLEQHQQILERIGPTRQMQSGHPRAVFVHRLVAADTLDSAVLDRLDGKASVQDALLQAVSTA